MKIFFVILFFIGMVWYLLIIYSRGNPRFWKKVRKNPDLATKLFMESKSWLVNPPKNFHIDSKEWMGPFRISVPALNGTMIKIYGKIGEYEESQRTIIKML